MKKITLAFTVMIFLVFCFSAGAQTTYTEEIYTYTINDNYATVIFCDSSASGSITVPSTLGGYVVNKIDTYAFENCRNITSVILPDSITLLGQNAFSGCDKLNSVVIGNGVLKIPEWLFYNCTDLETVTIGSTVEKINIAAFENCSGLKNINVSDNNPYYSSLNGVLYNKDKTELICYPQGKTDEAYVVPESVLTVGDGVFVNTNALTGIVLGSKVEAVSDGAFAGCGSLATISVNENNKLYSSEAGVLFNKEKSTLVSYPQAKADESYEVPEGVLAVLPYSFSNCINLAKLMLSDSINEIGKYGFYNCMKLSDISLSSEIESIADSAFSLCSSVEAITIPEGISAIGKYAFSGCENLKKVTLFDSVTSIDLSAFNYCDAITDVYYTADTNKWDTIDIKTGNGSITNALIHYNWFIVTDIETEKDSLGNINVSVKAKNIPSGSIAYVAAFDKDGIMLEIKSISDENPDVSFEDARTEYVKLFVWNVNLSPVIDEQEKSI